MFTEPDTNTDTENREIINSPEIWTSTVPSTLYIKEAHTDAYPVTLSSI